MTMDTLSGTLKVQMAITAGKSVGLDNPVDALREVFSQALAVGTSSDQIDEMYHAERTIGGAPDDLDLAGGLTDALGQVITFAEIVAVLIVHSGGTADITIGNAAANGATLWFGALTHTEVLEAEGWTFHMAPNDGAWPITAGTADILRVNGTNGDTYKIVILGRSA